MARLLETLAGMGRGVASRLDAGRFLAGTAAGAALGVALGVLGAWWFSSGTAPPPAAAAATPTAAKTASDQPTLWTCSMHPQIRQPEPGKCPICGMDLVPVTASAGGLRSLTITPEARELMKIQTRPVERRFVTAEVRMVGKVDYDETRLGYITAWVGGRLDRLYVDYTGIRVNKGDHMIYIYSPELYAAQEELIRAIQYSRQNQAAPAGGIDLIESAREKLRLLGLPDEQIREIEQRGAPSDHVTIYAPMGGIVTEKLRQEGDYVRTGERIYTVADLSQVWVKLDAYESDLPWLHYGQRVTFTTEAFPGEYFTGRISFIDPILDEKTRTVKVRVNVPNEQGKLKPGMFVHGLVRSRVATGGRVLDPDLAGKWICPMHPEVVADRPGKCDRCGMPLERAESLGYVGLDSAKADKPLVIPASAVLLTGTRAVVYVEKPDAEAPTFEGREIVLGPRAGDYYIVRSGLAEGEMVVTQGNFKIDSEIQIQAKPSMMTPEGGGGRLEEELPDSFQRQLQALETASRDVERAVAGGDLARSRAAFDRLGAALNRVSGAGLSETALAVWNDLAMVLNNDVVEGREAQRMDDARRALESLGDHMERLRRVFPLPPPEPRPERLAVPPAAQKQLAGLWQAYLQLHAALAGDDEPGARTAVQAVRQALEGVDARLFADQAAEAWRQERTNLDNVLRQLESASGLKALRAAFLPLSHELEALALTFGFGPDAVVYRHHCPMAFGGRGATWLQSDDQTRNPYYGAAMLRCADAVEHLAGEASGSAGDGKGMERQGN